MRTLSSFLVLAALAGTVAGCGSKQPKVEELSEDEALDPTLNFNKGLEYLRSSKDYAGAYTSFTTAAKIFAEKGDNEAAKRAMFNAAKSAEVLGKMDEAERYYKSAYDLDDNYEAAVFSLARVYTENGKGTEASAIYRKFVDAHPDDLSVRNLLVSGLYAAGDLEGATAEAQEILRRDPKNAAVYRSLSAIYYDQQNYGMSQLCAEKALGLNDGDPGTYNNMGVTYLIQANEPAAIEKFKTAIKIDPDNYEANMNLGFVALNSGDYNLANDCFTKAVASDPASTDARLGLAVAKRGLKEFDESSKLYDEIIAADPDLNVAYFNAATLHKKYTKNFKKAKKYLQDFVDANEGKIGPNHEVFNLIGEIDKLEAEEKARQAEAARLKKEAEERERRNKELLSNMGSRVSKYQSALSANKACLDEMMVMEGEMILEQAQMVVEAEDASMAQDINTLLDGYAPTWDEAIAACGSGGSAAPAEEAPAEEAPAEEAPAEEAPAEEAPAE